MNIEFEDIALKELYTKGRTNDGKYHKLPKDIVKQYRLFFYSSPNKKEL